MIKTLKILIPLIILTALAIFGWQLYRHFQPAEEIEVFPTRAGDVEQMVRLCSMEIYNEVPVLDTVNSKVMFAIQKQNGTISFDVENINIDDSGDTVKIQLPREIVEVFESTEKDSWQVIDTRAIGPMSIFNSDNFSIQEENRVKAKLQANSVKRLYANGTVRQARKDAVDNLTRLMQSVYRKPVIVSDPTPEGTPPKSKFK